MSFAVLLVDHGSRHRDANQAVHQVARLMSRPQSDTTSPPTRVTAAHMELANPDIREGLQQHKQTGVDHVVVVPFMLAPGRHASQDIPRMSRALGLELGLKITVTEPLGPDALLGELAHKRVMESLTKDPSPDRPASGS